MEDKKHQQQDPLLNTPSESNTQKHINFLDVEAESAGKSAKDNRDEFAEERQKQWQQGIEEGREERNK